MLSQDALWKSPGSALLLFSLPLAVNAIKALEAPAGASALTSPLNPDPVHSGLPCAYAAT